MHGIPTGCRSGLALHVGIHAQLVASRMQTSGEPIGDRETLLAD
jgi:hypothetical protein